MQEKITFSQLCSMVSARASVSRKVTEEYLRAFFGAIGDGLASSDTVKIKGLGTFKVIRIAERRSVNVSTGQEIVIPSHNRITFTPSQAIAQAVNAPFAAFETVELADDFTDAELAAFDDSQVPEEAPAMPVSVDGEEVDTPDVVEPLPTQVSATITAIPDAGQDGFEEILPAPKTDQGERDGMEVSGPEDNAENPAPPVVPVAVAEEPVTHPAPVPSITAGTVAVADQKRKMRFTFWGGFCSALALVTIAGGLIILFWPEILKINPWPTEVEHKLETAISKSTANKESQVAVPFDDEAEKQALTPVTEPGAEAADKPVTETVDDAPVYDTITRTRYLTTMAKDHYGNYHFWPYIYEENKRFLGHPDRIKPGTQVVVPPLSKYGVDPANPEDLRRAKKMGVEIYARYR